MQGGWLSKQKVSTKQLQNIKSHLQQIKNQSSPRLLSSLQSIVTFFLGGYQSNGILSRLGQQFSNFESLQWAKQLQGFLQHIGPESATFAQIVNKSKDPNAQFLIDRSYLPHYIDPNSYNKGKLINLKFTHSGIYISPLDGFYLMLAYAIYNSQTIMQPMTQFQQLVIDDFYSSLSRNPLLILLRKNLQYFSFRQKNVIQKIVCMLRMYLVDEVLIKYELDRKKNGIDNQGARFLNTSQDSILSNVSFRQQIQLKYRLKQHHIHALYLVMRFTPQYFSNQFSKYCQAVTQYYSVLKPNAECLQSLIRLWIYGMLIKNQDNIQNQVIRVLQRANSRQGWFHLKRYSPASIYVVQHMNVFNTQTLFNIFKIIQKQSNWIASPSYLFSFACLFRFLTQSKMFNFQFLNPRRISNSPSRQSAAVQKIFKIIVVRFNQNLSDICSRINRKNPNEYRQAFALILNYEQIIENYFNEYFKHRNVQSSYKKSPHLNAEDPVPQQFKFKEIKISDLNTNEDATTVALDTAQKYSSQSKRHLVAYYRSQNRSCWEAPIQYNESSILYWLFYTLAKLIDSIIPGKRENPQLNIRFLADPFYLMGIIAVIFAMYLIFG